MQDAGRRDACRTAAVRGVRETVYAVVRAADPAPGHQHPIADVGCIKTRRKGAERQAKFVSVDVAMNIELKLKVEDLNTRYAQAIDDDKLEAWPDLDRKSTRLNSSHVAT